MEPIFNALPALLEQQAVGELMTLNQKTAEYGMVLSGADARELVETRSIALKSYGRVEFGSGVIGRLIEKFSDSPYLHQRNYAATLHDLIEAFYYFKGEALDRISDDELIEQMKEAFNNRCRGSVELLLGRELEKLAKEKRFEGPVSLSEPDDSEFEDENTAWDDEWRWNHDAQ